MKSVLCTLFGFNYLDKGLALYESLEKVAGNFVLYALAMDDDCFNYLSECKYDSLVPIRLPDFENSDLLEAKGNRSFGEYCWTCSSSLIKYVLDRYGEPWCAYIDADMYFYSDPAVLFRELEERHASILLTGHRFSRFEKDREKSVGRFCVEFNLFRNDADARRLLDEWIFKCLDECSAEEGSSSFGDQTYLDEWVDRNDFVIETHNPGAGVAPWNISQYKLVSHDESSGGYRLRIGKQEVDLVFFHFAGLKYLNRNLADISLYYYWGIDDSFVVPLYEDYLGALEKYKQEIFDRTGLEILLKSHPAFNRKRLSLPEKAKALAGRLLSKGGLRHFFYVEVPQKIKQKKNLIAVPGRE